MAVVPITIQCLVYPRNKTVAPFPATIVGYASITGLEVGGGPIEPPEEKPPLPPLTIWPKPGDPDMPWPDPPPSVWPPDPPPVDIPAPEPPHEGWNWSAVKGQWYYLYVPGEGTAQPKRR